MRAMSRARTTLWMSGRGALVAVLLAALAIVGGDHPASAETYTGHGAAIHGDVKYPADFTHFDYVNPDAPKGGTLRLAAIGSFDSLNPYIIKGLSAAGLGLMFETLMASSDDEASSSYGLLASRIEYPQDRSWVQFTLRPEARWHDGTPVTADDVIFSFDTLRSDGTPLYRVYYADVARTEKIDAQTVRFVFSHAGNRELPFILGQLPVLSKAYFERHPFNQTTLEPPLGSGPYKIAEFETARSITYRRDPDYWGADLPINRGRWNFDVIRYDYYRDATVTTEAFKAHEFDVRVENSAKDWATAYAGPQFDNGRAIREEIPHELPTGMQGFAMNLRKPIFHDRRVRQALGYSFDFEWANKALFYGAYARTTSYFSNSELASSGLPSAAERAILEPYRDQLPPELFTTGYTPPTTDGSGRIRSQLREAAQLLDDAGWRIVDGARRDPETGQAMEIEFLLVQPSFERIVQPMVGNLERLGIRATIRIVDTAQYQNRVDNYDFDIIVASFGQSLSPGNEQRDYWSSASADVPGGRNVIGIKDPIVDALVEALILSPDRESLITAARALDRVLLWGHYVVPQFHIRVFRVARWDKFGRPAISPRYALGLVDTWWVDPDKAAALDAATR